MLGRTGTAPGIAAKGIRVTQDLWIRRFHPSPDALVSLVCLPHAGGSASYYVPVSRGLHAVADVLAIQYPGRQDRRTTSCLETIEALADGVFEALHSWTDRPLALFGHSMGASVAYELALRLDKADTPPTALFASGRRAPSRHRDEKIHLLPDDGLLADVRSLSGTDATILQDNEILRIALPAIRADYKAAETYRGQEDTSLSCPIHVHIGDADPKVSPDEARAWENHTTGPFTFTAYPGGHFYLNTHTSEIIESIATELHRTAVTTCGRPVRS